jgi:His/Glu/Gln/Arg/opine family amino acid ABC transporter permease subunit
MSDLQMHNQPYVRESMLPEQEPPLLEAGLTKWVRSNLFSSKLNIVLTLVSIVVVFFLLKVIIGWMFVPTWESSSLTECREIFLGLGREGHFAGACWGIIRDRFLQFMFGFYPAEGYWRILLSFALMLLALAPVLFNSLPRIMLWFSALYPFFFPWFLWGGNIWLPILVILGLVLGYIAFRIIAPMFGVIVGNIAAVLVTVLWMMFGVSNVNAMLNTMFTDARLETLIPSLASDIEALPEPIAELTVGIDSRIAAIADADVRKAEIVDELEPVAKAIKGVEFLEELQHDLSGVGAFDNADDVTELRRTLTRTVNALGEPQSDLLADFKFSVGELLTVTQQEDVNPASVGESFAQLAGSLDRTLEPLQRDIPALLDQRSELSDRLLAHISETLPLREELTVLQRDRNRLESALSDKTSLLANLEKLPDTRAERDGASESRRQALNTAIGETEGEAGLVGLTPVPSANFGGFALSVIIGVTCILISLPLGILLALGRQSNLFIVKTICVGFIEFIRGVPLITLLFVASTLLNYFMPPGTNFDIILRVIIMVTLFAAAYMAEVIRGGLAALPTGQYEGADSLGLDYWQSQRLIIMPQALKISIPGIVSTFIGVFKDTVLVSIIGLLDPIGLSNAVRADAAWNGVVWEIYAFIAFMFFIFCFAMSRYSMYLERKLQTGHR